MERRKNAWPEIAYTLSDSTVGELMLALTVGKEKLMRLDGMTETAQTTASKTGKNQQRRSRHLKIPSTRRETGIQSLYTRRIISYSET